MGSHILKGALKGLYLVSREEFILLVSVALKKSVKFCSFNRHFTHSQTCVADFLRHRHRLLAGTEIYLHSPAARSVTAGGNEGTTSPVCLMGIDDKTEGPQVGTPSQCRAIIGTVIKQGEQCFLVAFSPVP